MIAAQTQPNISSFMEKVIRSGHLKEKMSEPENNKMLRTIC